ncbi:valyl-tRNA synthetase [Desulfosalsimonas propionicica]|uniref:Valine--tRNA ligase n=1 Tax=Desulfosalsimonas propionicica TaxID=332175 RepID=A0A7W0HJY6_9BACT|nr:valine--tRNA ligase [Desulfosalsimonas propionicica]MBA2880593.1 valyl-tRNA synthetase [Desulfosalsimonas propionicica]
MSGKEINKGYEPAEVEKRWYAYWEENGLFQADENPANDAEAFSIVIPPPNVTGVLHMGHALNTTLQDILCRYRRLCGDNVLWLPGTDHAGIATQNVVERQLAADGVDRHQMGRQDFIQAVWQWRQKYGSAIIRQLKSLGASCDWSRERFTMDDGLSAAVRKVFVELYEQGLIYQGNYIINWCPRCNTALADIEVEHETLQGHLYHIRYPYENQEGGPVVATTRPETMLGDTAVAVHPDDARYADISSNHVMLPLTGRKIPIIRDEYVDMEFGTGALKITPAHDPNDFVVGEKHGLESVKVIDDNGIMSEAAGDFAGMDRFACREAVVSALQEQGLLVKVEDYEHSVGHCYRCATVVEPNLSRQWFVKTRPLAEIAVDAVRQEQTRIVPEKWKNDYFVWMENIRDWCISRQIWWGHQIPAWTCSDCEKLIVATKAPEACPHCGSIALVQDPDVLDTWFSSALWPFSTMGWPEKTPLLERFYPTSVLVTGFDILFFWVARMMMMGIHFMAQVPFYDVYVHALVRDADGKKMSKSSGNVIDPISVIENYGTDALRFTLAAFAAQGRDIKLSEKRIEGYRHFINKLWNAARFSLMHLEAEHPEFAESDLSLADRWILSRLKCTTKLVSDSLDSYYFNEGANGLYRFVWHEFCDWYLEAAKPALYGKIDEKSQNATRAVLWRVLHDVLILLHPFVPFVTEEIWHRLPGTSDSIMRAPFPGRDSKLPEINADATSETGMEQIMEVITAVRNIRGEMNISPSASLSVLVQAEDADVRTNLESHKNMIVTLARIADLEIAPAGEKPRGTATAIASCAAVSVYLEGVIDFAKELARLDKEISKLEKEIQGLEKKLNNQGFLSKAPADVVEQVRQQHADATEKIGKLEVNREKIQQIESVQT